MQLHDISSEQFHSLNPASEKHSIWINSDKLSTQEKVSSLQSMLQQMATKPVPVKHFTEL